jgi:hypothetical protein
MDDDFQQLEQELKRLRPVKPTPDLIARLQHDFRSPERAARSRAWAWLALPAFGAVAAAVVALLRPDSTPTGSPGAAATVSPPSVSIAPFKPVESEKLLVDARDEGYVTLADGTPAHRVRQSYVDTITWKNPQTNASLKWSVPREEVRVVPVSFQ